MSESNVFLLINLGCEMLYVIDQRLQAQSIPLEKSAQVMNDITTVLLDPKFLDGLILGSQQKQLLLTVEHCKLMLNDIACCSLMRLDGNSMDKLWDLITMIFKWDLFTSKYPQHVLNITFRHLDGIAQLHPEVKKSILIDYTKNKILNFWNSNDEMQMKIFKTLKSWLELFSMKISILIRLGFQGLDGSFIKNPEISYYDEFVQTAGDNIYIKSVEICKLVNKKDTRSDGLNEYNSLVNQLNVVTNMGMDQTESIDVVRDLLFNEPLTFCLNDKGNSVNCDEQEKIGCTTEKVNNMNSSSGFTEIYTERNSSTTWEDLLKFKKESKDFKNLLKTNFK